MSVFLGSLSCSFCSSSPGASTENRSPSVAHPPSFAGLGTGCILHWLVQSPISGISDSADHIIFRFEEFIKNYVKKNDSGEGALAGNMTRLPLKRLTVWQNLSILNKRFLENGIVPFLVEDTWVSDYWQLWGKISMPSESFIPHHTKPVSCKYTDDEHFM